MATHIHRTIIVVPVAKVAAVVAWIRANVDDTCPANIGPALNASGIAADSATHRWQCCAWTDAQCKALLARLCQLASVTPPTNGQWNGWTGAQKRAWLASVRAAVLSGFGIYVTLANNEGQWDEPSDALAAMGLKVKANG